MTAQDDAPVLSLLEQITDAVQQAEASSKLAKEGKEASAASRAKTYDALALALQLHQIAQDSETAQAQLEKLYREREIKEPRKDANPFTRLAKLCFPGRTSVDYSRYAWALTSAEDQGHDPERFRDELNQCGLVYVAQIAKEVHQGESLDAAAQRVLDEGLAILRLRNSLASIEWPDGEDAVELVGIRGKDGRLHIYYHEAFGSDEDANKRIRGLARRRATARKPAKNTSASKDK